MNSTIAKYSERATAPFHTGALHVTEGRDCNFTSHNAIVGGQLVRNDTTTLLAGEGIESTLNGVFSREWTTVRIGQSTRTIEHAQPNCNSHELYKGILGDHSQGVFRGKIHVHQVAQKTNAYQSNQNLLLSDDADITSKPQLEIYADDVKVQSRLDDGTARCGGHLLPAFPGASAKRPGRFHLDEGFLLTKSSTASRMKRRA